MTFLDSVNILREFNKILSTREDELLKILQALDVENLKNIQDFVESLSYKNGVVDLVEDPTDQLLSLKRTLKNNYNNPDIQSAIRQYIDDIPGLLYQYTRSASLINGLRTGEVYNEKLAEYYVSKLEDSFGADAYSKDLVQPLTDTYRKLLNEGASLKRIRTELVTSGGKVAAYSKTIVLDGNRSMIGEANNEIADKYQLDGFIYEGGLVKHSRGLCVKLVDLRRPIGLLEIDLFLKDDTLHDGLIAGTNKSNFIQRVGGYGCRHHATPVRLTNKNKAAINLYWGRELYKVAA